VVTSKYDRIMFVYEGLKSQISVDFLSPRARSFAKSFGRRRKARGYWGHVFFKLGLSFFAQKAI